MPENCYLILGVSRRAGREEIRQAYRSIIRRLHPDVTRTEETTPEFLRVREAYETLMDEEKRRGHDLRLGRAEAGRGRARRTGSGAWRPAPAGVDPFRPSMLEQLLFHRPRDLELEIELTPTEARQGGSLPIDVPLDRECPRCSGRRLEWGWPCPLCAGRGRVREEHEVVLVIPAGVTDGTVLRRGLADLGRPESLRAVVRVGGYVA